MFDIVDNALDSLCRKIPNLKTLICYLNKRIHWFQGVQSLHESELPVGGCPLGKQSCKLQPIRSVGSPVPQWLGIEQTRVRNFLPPPQLAEQVDHNDQKSHWPSLGGDCGNWLFFNGHRSFGQLVERSRGNRAVWSQDKS